MQDLRGFKLDWVLIGFRLCCIMFCFEFLYCQLFKIYMKQLCSLLCFIVLHCIVVLCVCV